LNPAALNPAALNPMVKQIVESISEQRIAATLKKLEAFGTRYALSAQDDPVHGIGAAKRWIRDELTGYSPRLEVSYQNFSIKKGAAQEGRSARPDHSRRGIVEHYRGAAGEHSEGPLCSGDGAL